MPAICSQCGINGCSNILVESTTNQINITLPFIRTKQNERVFGSSSISADELFQIADIPALDFGLSIQDFCSFTSAQISNDSMGIKPSLWQRQTDVTRVKGIAEWLIQAGTHVNSMPDGILIGESQPGAVTLSARPHSIIGDWEIYSLVIEHNLIDSCPSCGIFHDETGNPIYRNRCKNHECQHHAISTSPFQIIDGQHRSLGIFKSEMENKQMSVSILLQNHNLNGIGYSYSDQAVVFTQVNTEASDLDKLHKTWLKRFFGNAWSVPSDARDAFDLLVNLGKPYAPAIVNFWSNFVKAHPTSGARFRIDTTRASDAGSGQIGGESSVESIMPTLDRISTNVLSKERIMMNWLSAAVYTYPNFFGYPAHRYIFDSERAFEALVRSFPAIVAHVELNPMFTGNFTQDDFVWSFEQHSIAFANSNVWERFRASGEDTLKEFYQIIQLMWDSTGGPDLPIAPNWFTNYPAVPCPNWVEYIKLTPDPINNISIPTMLRQGKMDPADGIDFNTPVAELNPESTISWERPRNTVSKVRASYRYMDILVGDWTSWYSDPSTSNEPAAGSGKRECSKTLKLENLQEYMGSGNQNVQWQLQLVYSNINGESPIILEFITN